jgi:hypothetical protein
VLGPGPPPWREVEIYRFLPVFWVLGAFNRAGKSVSKIGIYALPPLKSDFYGIFYKMGLDFSFFSTFLDWVVCWVLFCLLLLDRECMLPMSFSFVDYLGSLV